MQENREGDGLRRKLAKTGFDTLLRHRDIYEEEILRRRLEMSGLEVEVFQELHTTPNCRVNQVVKGYFPSGFYDVDGIEHNGEKAVFRCEFHNSESRWFMARIV